jgi:hypothetical protein
MLRKLTNQSKNNIRNELGWGGYLPWRWKTKRSPSRFPKHFFTLPQGSTYEMGGNKMKKASVEVFIGEEVEVDKNQ